MGTWLKFSVFIDGKLADATWLDTAKDDDTAEAIADRQAALVEAAGPTADIRLEMFDPDLPPHLATLVVATSAVGMANPVKFKRLEDAVPVLLDDFRARHEAAGG